MKRAVFGACLAVAFAAVVVSAQDKNMSMGKMDHMSIEKTRGTESRTGRDW